MAGNTDNVVHIQLKGLEEAGAEADKLCAKLEEAKALVKELGELMSGLEISIVEETEFEIKSV